MGELNPHASINLEQASVMLVDDNPEGMAILVQIITAFGVKLLQRATTAEMAEKLSGTVPLDLVLASATLRVSSGYDFTSWLRRSNLKPNAYAPVILVSGHTVLSDVQKARDCGANFLVAKPVSPNVLFERAAWISRENRKFVEAEGYIGPDRRFSSMGPPVGTNGRRADDLPAEVGLATTPNLDQSDIDALFKPKRA